MKQTNKQKSIITTITNSTFTALLRFDDILELNVTK